jgi:hypothetical protein
MYLLFAIFVVYYYFKYSHKIPTFRLDWTSVVSTPTSHNDLIFNYNINIKNINYKKKKNRNVNYNISQVLKIIFMCCVFAIEVKILM